MKNIEQILSEKELLEISINESRLKTAQALASIGNWELDLTTSELYWSDEIFNLFEIDKNKFEASYEAFLNAIHPDDRSVVNDTYLNSLETKKKYTIQHRLLMKDGRIKYVEEKYESYFDYEGKPVKSLGTVQDITELALAELEVEKKQKELEKYIAFLKSHQLAMDESSIVSKADLNGKIIYVNDNFCKVSGYSKEEVIGKPHNLLRHPKSSKETFKELWKTIKSKKVWKGILLNKGKVNDYWVDITILPILDEQDNIVEYIAVRHDVTKMIKQQTKLDNAANTDILTGLWNRYKLNNDILNSINPALAILNIDNFSHINDFYGHDNGDEVIRKLGKLISDFLLESKCDVYHLQGDEFVIFNKDILKDDFISQVTEIASLVSKRPILIEDKELFLNLSTAISFEHKGKILSTADMAFRVAKTENKNIVVYSDSISLNEKYQNNIRWAKKIRDGLEQDRFIPVFQPIVNNRNNAWEKYECLVRLRDDDKLISPYFFLDISKKTKHYIDITKVMLRKSFEIFKDRDVEFSVNLTIEDMLNEDMQSYIFNLLESYNIGHRVVFEIVESESIENFEQIHKFIEKIKSYKCKIAIDDFGTGYSNFEYLLKLKADYVKIDGSMIKNIDADTNTQLVVSTIVEFAKKMNMKTIAEFVENKSILNKVKELDVDYSQGYHFSEPQENLDVRSTI